jgi:hypothetical protein
MKGLSHRQPAVFRFAVLLLGALVITSLPFLLDLMSRAMTWAVAHLPEVHKYWEIPLWFR